MSVEKLVASCSVKAYENKGGSWQLVSASGSASVGLYEGMRGAGTYRLVASHSHNSKAFLNAQITAGCRYVQQTPVFHCFSCASPPLCFGFNLLVAGLAAPFARHVLRALQRVRASTTASTTSTAASTTGTTANTAASTTSTTASTTGSVADTRRLLDVSRVGLAPRLSAPPLSKRMFDKFDADQSGEIDPAEFRMLCFEMGYFLSPLELKAAMKLVDVDGNGQISYDEFLGWWTQTDRWSSIALSEENMGRMQKCAQAFKKVDTDFSGSVDRSEFKQLYQLLPSPKSSENTLYNTIDTDGDGEISFNEFAVFVMERGLQL